MTGARAATRTAELRPFEIARLPELMSWFPDKSSCQTWGGIEFRFPFTAESFREDTRLAQIPGWSLVLEDGALGGFGQYYLRVGRCHLGRLAIAPSCRGQGLGSTLVRELCERGRAELNVKSCSLFVVPENERALKLYQRLAFEAIPYPEPSPALRPYIYLVADGAVRSRFRGGADANQSV